MKEDGYPTLARRISRHVSFRHIGLRPKVLGQFLCFQIELSATLCSQSSNDAETEYGANVIIAF